MIKQIALTEIIVSIAVHVRNVSLTVIPKYSLMSQKPESLTCDRIKEPAPVANTRSSLLTPGMTDAIGATMPAAVIMATVAEPVATRMTAAIVQLKRTGEKLECFAMSAIYVPTPESIRTLLKAPPAPITSRMEAIGPRQSLLNFKMLSLSKP